MVRKGKCQNIFERDKVTEKRSGRVKTHVDSYVVDMHTCQRPHVGF